MNGERIELRSAGIAILFFSALSSVTAVATALLPFILVH